MAVIDNLAKIPEFEKEIENGICYVLVVAAWCPACTRFKKNIWGPSLKKKALHNRVEIESELIKNTSLANTKFDYLPSIIVVENGRAKEFSGPEGATNAMPTPKTLRDMTRIVNVPIKPEVANADFSRTTVLRNPEPVRQTRKKNHSFSMTPITLQEGGTLLKALDRLNKKVGSRRLRNKRPPCHK
jgi:hypothetical protein